MSFSTSGLSVDAIGQLYTGHHRWLLGWLQRRVGCRDQAADLAQDTFVKVLRSRNSLYVEEARALLSTIARSIVVDHFRRRALEQAFLDALALIPEPQSPSPEARSLVLEALLAVDRMLDGLPDKVRRAFLLSQLDGMGYRDIATELGVSVSSVQQYMTRAYAACYAAQYADET
ncbi:sigma-70 family RNA polymerase sigma factor [Pigmentiphaga aceris]|uniref:Sigma-70 family RNA polymerase sigma factor n=1 Tax=Pigmentiphaga aceris TaxID=1940612 RepID=A0A5C0B2C9_9BURK|nr:sigma-70 family RNA polymerase sigma factor [Pigmentiphaga aceris]QEI07330.1 sigma-70 family RNA polymerase sigma factor [Pigmentiphaga aceris]